MRNILVPTDFSDCAKHACDAAYALAKRFGAKIHLLTSLDLPPYWDNLPPAERARWANVQEDVESTETALKKLQEQYPDTETTTFAASASLPDAVNNYITSHGIDLVVIGSHGTSGKNEFFLGSNTQKVIRTVHCPTLVIKHPLKKLDFRKVVFASSFHASEMEAFLFFKNFIKHFVPEVHLVAIHKSVFDASSAIQKAAMEPFKEACKPLLCKTHVYNDFSVDAGVRAFADEIGADLVAISYNERHPLKRILSGSNVEALVNHSKLPVLTIDF